MKNLITLVGAIFSLFLGISTFAIESLSYSVLEEAGEIEIREYEPHILASVQVAGNFEDAGSKAFRPLFKFITGENIGNEKIAMTAPVIQTTQNSRW